MTTPRTAPRPCEELYRGYDIHHDALGGCTVEHPDYGPEVTVTDDGVERVVRWHGAAALRRRIDATFRAPKGRAT